MDLTEQQLRLLVDCAPQPTVIYLMDGQSSSIKPFLYSHDVPAFSGLDEEEYLRLYGDDAAKVVLPQDMSTVYNALQRIFTSHGPETCTYRTYHRTKGMVWTQAAFKWIGEYDGHHVLLGNFSDVSNQVAEDTPGGFFIYAAQQDDQFFFIGENMLHILGYTREEFKKKFENRFRNMVYEPDRQMTLDSIDRQIAENGHYDNVDYRIEKKDGSLIWVHDEGHYVVDKDGRAWFYVTINDINGIVVSQQKLAKENQELGSIINAVPVGLGVYRIDADHITMVAVNKALCDVLEATQGQMLAGMDGLFAQRAHPQDLPTLIATMKSLPEAGRHQSLPFRYTAPSSGCKWLRLDAETVVGADGGRLVYNVVMDLTAERKAEQDLEEARQSQQDQYQSSLQALLFANPQSLCTVRMNLTRDICEEWYGTSQFVINTIKSDTAVGVIDNISHIIVNDNDRKSFRDHFDRDTLLAAFKDGKRRDIVRYRRTVEGGSFIWVETIVNMIENPNTHDIEAVLFSEDVNEQVMNEEIIQKSTDAGYDYIATLSIIDQEFFFRFLGGNLPQTYRDLYVDMKKAWPFDRIVAYAIKTWVAPDERQRFMDEASIDSMLGHLTAADNYAVTIKARTLTGVEGWKQLRLTWLDDTHDLILIQQTDVSDTMRRQQTEMMERLNAEKALRYEADKANESKSNFLSNVSHDMRTPLNAILGYDRLALDTSDPAVREDYLRKIGSAGTTLLSLINDTLDLQKIENGVTTLHPQPVSCRTVVDGILTAVRPLMDAKGIDFRFDNAKSVMATIMVDAIRVEEIFINLLSNAAKFTPAGGRVLFSVACEKETSQEIFDVMTVQDSGTGISSAFLPKIYEPFTQERSAQTAGIGGSGLGLSIVKRLVDLMRGQITVESTVGKGTTFTVRLTFRKADVAASSHNDGLNERPGVLEGAKILLCEDNEMNREIATAILDKYGMTVVPAVNGRQGVDVFTKSKPGELAAVLMDIRMPIMDGYEASKAIRTSDHPDARRIPIIALTADAYYGDARKAKECGMNSHLPKPINPEALIAALQESITKC